jgi:HK97 family phage prohead protease
MTIERRFISVTELQAAKDGNTITGVAAAYNKLSEPLGSNSGGRAFRERIAPGAFRNAVKAGQDVTLLVNHDPKLLLGRTASGTLKLDDTRRGLEFRCSMPNTQLGHDTREMIQRGDLNGCSFGFSLGTRGDDAWEEEELEDEDNADLFDDQEKVHKRAKPRAKTLIRTIKNVTRLHDVSVVTNPAYPNGTSVDCRNLVEVYGTIPAGILTRYANQPRDEKGLFSNGEDAATMEQHSKSAAHHIDKAAQAQAAGNDKQAGLHRVAATAHDMAAKYPSPSATKFAQIASASANAGQDRQAVASTQFAKLIANSTPEEAVRLWQQFKVQ